MGANSQDGAVYIIHRKPVPKEERQTDKHIVFATYVPLIRSQVVVRLAMSFHIVLMSKLR